MSLYDQHLHSRHSFDSQADPFENVQQALARGLAGLTFTEHYDRHPSEWAVCRYDYAQIAATVAALRERYGRQIFIGHGIEVCHQPAQLESIREELTTHAYDLVLLSVHWFEGRALHERDHWQGLDLADATRRYFQAVLEATQHVALLNRRGERLFDVLGHLDLVRRYTQRYFGEHAVESCADLIDRILEEVLDAQLVLEVNFSSLRQALDEPMPARWVLARYAELGGTAVSMGSDAHRAEHVGHGLVEGAAMLREVGINHQAVFRRRERTDVPLPASI